MASEEQALQEELAQLQRELAPLEAELARRKQVDAEALARLAAEQESLPARLTQLEAESGTLVQRRTQAEDAARFFNPSWLDAKDRLLAAGSSLVVLLFMVASAAMWTLFVVHRVPEVGVGLQVVGLLAGLVVGKRRRPRRLP